MDNKFYDEVGINYRYFLGWRHASFAGNIIVVFSTLSFLYPMIRDNFKFSWVLPLIASPVGVLLWIIDVRTRTLYHAAIDAGKHLEGETGGFFTELDKVAFKKGTCIFSHLTQSLAVSILFLGSSALFIILSVILFITNL